MTCEGYQIVNLAPYAIQRTDALPPATAAAPPLKKTTTPRPAENHNTNLCSVNVRLYTPVWAKPTDFRDIVVSKRMFFDHIPTKSSPRFTETYKMLLEEGREAVASGLPGRGRPAEGGGEGTVGAMGISMGRSGSMPDVS